MNSYSVKKNKDTIKNNVVANENSIKNFFCLNGNIWSKQ